MGYALRRHDDDDDAVRPRGRFDRWFERMWERLVMSTRFAAQAAEARRMTRLVPNWDGQGGGPVPAPAAEAAERFLRRIHDKYGHGVSEPTVGAIGGGVVLVWHVNKRGPSGREIEREVEIIFHEKGNEFAVSDRTGVDPTMAGEDVDADALLRIVDRWIIA